MTTLQIFGLVSGIIILGSSIGAWIWKLSAKLKDLEKSQPPDRPKENVKFNGLTPHKQLLEEITESKEVSVKSYELLRDHVTKIAATGDRHIELLRELIQLQKQTQSDVTEMKIYNKVRDGK